MERVFQTCFDLLEVLTDVSWPCVRAQCGSAQSLVPFGSLWYHCCRSWPRTIGKRLDSSATSDFQALLSDRASQCTQHIQSLDMLLSISSWFCRYMSLYYGFLGHGTWQVLISPAALLHHLDLFSTFFSCARYSTPSVEAVRRSRKSSCDLDSFDTRE